jgi:hypothetical protein
MCMPFLTLVISLMGSVPFGDPDENNYEIEGSNS